MYSQCLCASVHNVYSCRLMPGEDYFHIFHVFKQNKTKQNCDIIIYYSCIINNMTVQISVMTILY